MQLKTVVKVAEVNNLSDARYCAGMGVQLVGFVMKHDSKTVIPKENYLAITGWLEGVEFVGEFWSASDEEILDLNSELNFTYIQTDDVAQAERLFKQGLKVIFFTNVFPKESMDFVSFVVVENEEYVVDKELEEASSRNEILFGGEVNASDLDLITTSESISGIQLKGGDEIRPGYKDFDELADILEALDENF